MYNNETINSYNKTISSNSSFEETYDIWSNIFNYEYKIPDNYQAGIKLYITMPCLIKGTLITLLDFSKKPIEDITFEDELLVWDFYEGKFSTAKPLFIKQVQTADEYNLCKFSDGSELGLVGSNGYHRIWNEEANMFTHTGTPDTPNGIHTFNQNQENPELISQEIIRKPVEYYNIITDKHYNLFANGILTSMHWNNRYGIKNMKYDISDVKIDVNTINKEIEKMKNNPIWIYNTEIL